MNFDKEKLTSPIVLGSSTFLTIGAIDLIANGGPAGLIFGALPLAYVAAKYGKGLFATAQDAITPTKEVAVQPAQAQSSERNLWQRAFGIYPDAVEEVAPEEEETYSLDDEFDNELVLPVSISGFNFSSMLDSFNPSLSCIYLATLPDGTHVTCAAKDLCHVAIAGRTRHGKSSITRLLMSQLCHAGASVLLLDPHYTPYDVETGEDWTPFTPYLIHDPLECCQYATIEYWLAQIAEKLIPTRLKRRREGKKLGKPYFIVLDELPDIVANVKDASAHLAKILREGGKLGVFVIASSQDFLVKTIFPDGEGAVRACYLTAYDVGGDPTTSRVLLGVPASKMPATKLGKGPVMLRCHSIEQAVLARVPLTDNDALYYLLGPSTYTDAMTDVEDEMLLEHLTPTFRSQSLFRNTETGGVSGNETASEADVPVMEPIPFPVSGNVGNAAASRGKAPEVSEETKRIVQRMAKSGKFTMRDISAAVGLSGEKYWLFREVCEELGIKREAQA